jgi:hypothetical protein
VPYNFSKMTKIGEVWVGFVVAASNPLKLSMAQG